MESTQLDKKINGLAIGKDKKDVFNDYGDDDEDDDSNTITESNDNTNIGSGNEVNVTVEYNSNNSKSNNKKGTIRNSSSSGTINNIENETIAIVDTANNKTILESPRSSSSSSSDSSSISSSIYEPIIKEINQSIYSSSSIITSIKTETTATSTENTIQYENNNTNFDNNNVYNENISSSSSSSKDIEELNNLLNENNSNVNNDVTAVVTTATITTTTTMTTTTATGISTVTPTVLAITRSSPFYNSNAPDIKTEVNGFPIKLHHMKTKEFIWLQHIKSYTHDNVISKDISKLVRLGIPKRIRGYVWRLFSGALELEKKNNGVYQHFLGKHSEEYEYKISKDIGRTFPNNPIFNNEQGQNSLFRILKAYCIFDPIIGYTQGMSFIAAVLLSEMDETESFWTFTSIMKNYKLSTLFCNDLSLLRQYLYVIDRLIETTNPKLFSHFKEIGVTPVLFASEWISTLFTYNFDLLISKRLLDVFFIEGRFYLHRMSLAILKMFEKQLMSFDFEDAVEFLKKLGSQNLKEPGNLEILLKIADSLPLTIPLIVEFEEEFHVSTCDYF